MKKKINKFEKEESQIDSLLDKADLSDAINAGSVVPGRKGRPPVGSKISITLPDDVIEAAKKAANKRAIGYQTLLRMIIKENIDHY